MTTKPLFYFRSSILTMKQMNASYFNLLFLNFKKKKLKTCFCKENGKTQRHTDHDTLQYVSDHKNNDSISYSHFCIIQTKRHIPLLGYSRPFLTLLSCTSALCCLKSCRWETESASQFQRTTWLYESILHIQLNLIIIYIVNNSSLPLIFKKILRL